MLQARPMFSELGRPCRRVRLPGQGLRLWGVLRLKVEHDRTPVPTLSKGELMSLLRRVDQEQHFCQ